MYYTDLEKVEEVRKRLELEKIDYIIFEVPNARIWKFWLGTQKSWENECRIIEKRKLKKR